MFWGDPELQGLHIGIFLAGLALIVFWVLLNRSVAGYEARAVGFNPDAAEYGGIHAGRTYTKVMLICGAFAGLAGVIDILGWQFAVATNDIQNAGVVGAGFIGIAVALLGRNTTSGVLFSALLFGALINGTSVRNLDPEVFPPELATNLTLIIQGLIVLLVSAPVIVTGAVQAAAAADAARGRDGGGRMSTASLAGRVDVARVERPVLVGWAAVALGLLAFWLALPPLLVRTPVPSLVLCAGRGRPRRLGRSARASAGWAGERSSAPSSARSARSPPPSRARRTSSASSSGPPSPPRCSASRRRLIFAALGGVISERSGVVNIGLEGMMLVGAFFGIYGADLTNGWIGGLLLGMLAGGLLALLHAVFAISLRSDQIVSGFAINFIALGMTGYIFLHHYGDEGTPDGLPQVPDVTLPIDWIPFFGPALDKLNLLVWVALILVFVVWLFVFRTPAGLRLRSVGENPRAAATVGISVYKTRYLAVIASGVLAAMGGAFLSIGFVHSFNQNMTAGRGFIALAVVIVGKWRPVAALAAALMFGFSQALAQRLAGVLRELGDPAPGAAVRGDPDRRGGAGRALDTAGGGRGAVLEGVRPR